MAGRDKDFAFINEVLDRGLADLGAFAERAALVADMPQMAALLPRLESLQTYLKDSCTTIDLRPLKELAECLRPL